MPFKGLFGLGKTGAGGRDLDIENYINDLSLRDGKVIERDDITYVKSISLDAEGRGTDEVVSELERKNIVVLNVRELMHNRPLLREMVHELRDACIEMDGDIGRISEDKILVVPAGMRIKEGENLGE